MKKILLVFIFILSFTIFQNSAFCEESNIYFIAYVNRLEHKIKSNWTLPHGQTDKTTIVTFKIDKNGNILNANVSNSSTDNEFDQAALTAVYKSAPFEAIPESIKDNNITFQYTFNQNLSEIKPISETTTTNLKSDSPTVILTQQQQKINEKLFEKKEKLIQKANLSNLDDNGMLLNSNYKIDNVDFKSYMQNLQKAIKSNWKPTKCNNSKQFIALFKIDKNGDLTSLKIYKSSGDNNFDKVALDAISQTTPFKPLPKEFCGDSINVQFTFDYNVFGEKVNANSFINNDTNNRTYADYQKMVETIISHSLPKRIFFFNKCLALRIKINKIGYLESVQVIHSSNDKKFDKLYVSAIKKCSFPPLPESLPLKTFSFDYIVQTKPKYCNVNNMVPINLSTPVGKVWAADVFARWAFMIFCVGHIH